MMSNNPVTEKDLQNMQATGVVRKVDDLGRVVLPKELRKILDVEERDPLEIFVLGEYILLHKYTPTCIFCGSMDGMENYKGKMVCAGCMEEMVARNQE